jgi:hypothetical protein
MPESLLTYSVLSYGARGQTIIFEVLKHLIPFGTCNCGPLHGPLNHSEFVLDVVVPEVMLRVLTEDLNVALDQALIEMHDSRELGLHAYRDNDDGDAFSELVLTAWQRASEASTSPRKTPLRRPRPVPAGPKVVQSDDTDIADDV